VHTNLHTFYGCAILTVHNDTVTAINNTILYSLNGLESIFHSIDTIKQDNPNTKNTPPPELLQSFNSAGLLSTQLCLKVGTPIILLQNLYPKEGLCNSTCMVFTQIGCHCLKAHILNNSFANQLQLILWIKLSSTEGKLPFIISQQQFPIHLSFAITVNKSQSQSFNFISIDLQMPVFTHNQLYVALSHITTVNSISVLLPPNQSEIENIIYLEVLLSL